MSFFLASGIPIFHDIPAFQCDTLSFYLFTQPFILFLYRRCVLRTFQNPVHFLFVLYQRLFGGGGRLCPPLSYSVMLIFYCMPTSQILRKMALMANQHDRIRFWALKSLRSCDLRAQNRQDGAHVQKITNVGYNFYVTVYPENSRRLYP